MTEISISAPTSSANQPLALSSERGSRPNSCGVLQPGTHQAEGMLWHYAPWFYLQHMVDSGDLRPSNAGAPDLTPTLWFSANQNWEPTATKLLPDARGCMVQGTFDQQNELLGCIRFGIDANDPRLLKWKDACTASNTSRIVRKSLEKAGLKMGGNPTHWFATLASVPLSDLLLQVWVGHWAQATSIQDMVSAWEVKCQRDAANGSQFNPIKRIQQLPRYCVSLHLAADSAAAPLSVLAHQ
jgi:hypothetical protein